MNALEFLTHMWPVAGNGHYCIAIPFIPKGSTKAIFSHKVFNTIAEAAKFCEKRKDSDDIFYCIHTLVAERVWNAKKKDPRTGALGAWEYRTQANMQACKNFFFDLDVGEVDEGGVPKYTTQREALEGLKNFCKTVKLPKPMIVSSGGGLHIYWRMNAAIPTAEWKETAAKLKQLAQVNGLKFDPSRTTDNASVLRVAGTFNQKRKDNPRPVKVYADSPEMSSEDFDKLLNDALIRANLPVTMVTPNLPAVVSDFSNTQKFFDGPPVSIRSLLGACPQIFRVAKLGGNVSEPEWYAALASVRLVDGGEEYVHKISAKHPNYSHAETEAKVAQLASADMGPTGCLKWHDLQPAICEACSLWGRVKSPMAAARIKPASRPPPKPLPPPAFITSPVVELIPKEPGGYIRNEHGIFMVKKNQKGDEISIQIYQNDLIPLRRIVNRKSKTEDQIWRVELPRSGAHDFTLPADALYDRKKFVSAIANNSIYTKNELIGDLQDYMIAYIAKLQQTADAETQHNHLGWTDDHAGFILPDRIICTDGQIKKVSLSQNALNASRFVTKNGDIQTQVQLLEFYNHPAYVAQQFFILCGLAAPIFHLTGHHGVIVNASGKPGASKSSSLYTASSFWGNTVKYALNGTNRGATANARDGRVFVLANLPVCVDEITNMDPKEAHNLAMSITQPGGRTRQNVDGTERVTNDSEKSTIMLSTSNTSLHSVLSDKNAGGTAGSMRVFEIHFIAGAVHSKPEADDYLHDLKLNYGHIGEVFMSSIIKHMPAIENRVRSVMRQIDIEGKVTAGERFWSATIASALVTCEIGNKLGLIPFDVKMVKQWVMQKQIPYMRGVVREEYSSPIVLLTDYLSVINENIFVVQSTMAKSNLALAAKMPRGALLARYEQDTGMMYILKSGFKQYATRNGANERLCLEELHQPKLDNTGREIRLVVQKNMRKVLGAGSELDKGQALVFVVDMNHPLIKDKVNLGISAQTPPAKGGQP